jgi:hypothetical protein
MKFQLLLAKSFLWLGYKLGRKYARIDAHTGKTSFIYDDAYKSLLSCFKH